MIPAAIKDCRGIGLFDEALVTSVRELLGGVR